jgi:MinD-like ATPase involved in chromosome partitioning or flagellar assembly
MDPTLLSLLETIPQKPPRSKLETHRELIRQLRRKGCTYRDIVRILHERVGLDVAISTIHSFVKVRAKHRKQVQYELPLLESESKPISASSDDVASRICCTEGKANRAKGQTETLSLRRKRTVEAREPGRVAMKTANGNKRVVFTMGGKGGVGKTGLMVALAEWFEAHEIPFTLLDLDTENKARGSLKHFFNGSVTKVNIHTPAGLDTFIDHLESGTAIILADMGAGSGQVASDWFDAMYEDISATGARFTAVGVITPDPASVESVLAWANRLQDRVQYVVVQNATGPQSNFSYWDSAEQAMRFRESLSPTVVRMEFRLAELENPARQHGVRLGQVATRQNSVDELKRASIVMRAESYRRRLFSEFDRAKEMFLP